MFLRKLFGNVSPEPIQATQEKEALARIAKLKEKKESLEADLKNCNRWLEDEQSIQERREKKKQNDILIFYR